MSKQENPQTAPAARFADLHPDLAEKARELARECHIRGVFSFVSLSICEPDGWNSFIGGGYSDEFLLASVIPSASQRVEHPEHFATAPLAVEAVESPKREDVDYPQDEPIFNDLHPELGELADQIADGAEKKELALFGIIGDLGERGYRVRNFMRCDAEFVMNAVLPTIDQAAPGLIDDYFVGTRLQLIAPEGERPSDEPFDA